jgi:hypothetical protein
MLINKGALSQQVGNNLVREMGALAQTDEKMHKLLQNSGFNLSASPTPRP